MGILDFFKKRQKSRTLDIPPPPGIGGPEFLHLPPELKKETPSLPKFGIPKEKPEQMVSLPPHLQREWKKPSAPLLRERLSRLKERKEEEPEFEVPKLEEFGLGELEEQKERPKPEEPKLEKAKPEKKEKKFSIAERKAAEPEEPKRKFVLKERPSRVYDEPKFVGVEDFQYMLNKINHMRKTLSDSENTIKKMNELKNQEEKMLEQWRMRIESIEKRLNQVDSIISTGE